MYHFKVKFSATRIHFFSKRNGTYILMKFKSTNAVSDISNPCNGSLSSKYSSIDFPTNNRRNTIKNTLHVNGTFPIHRVLARDQSASLQDWQKLARTGEIVWFYNGRDRKKTGKIVRNGHFGRAVSESWLLNPCLYIMKYTLHSVTWTRNTAYHWTCHIFWSMTMSSKL